MAPGLGWGRPGLLLTGLLLLGEVAVNATVEMKTKVDNRAFTEELRDKNSAAFKAFENDFKEKVRVQRCWGHPHAGPASLGGVFGA